MYILFICAKYKKSGMNNEFSLILKESIQLHNDSVQKYFFFSNLHLK